MVWHILYCAILYRLSVAAFTSFLRNLLFFHKVFCLVKLHLNFLYQPLTSVTFQQLNLLSFYLFQHVTFPVITLSKFCFLDFELLPMAILKPFFRLFSSYCYEKYVVSLLCFLSNHPTLQSNSSMN